MYNLLLTINGQELNLDMSHGYVISTVDGLTGVNSRLDTVQAANGIGEAYTGGTVQGQTITIRGKILDHNVEAKQALIDTAVPLGEGTLTVLDDRSGQSGRVTPYRTIDVVVRTTPQIAQVEHSKFTLTLYAPSPIWYAAERETITLENTLSVPFVNDGQVPAEYELRAMTIDAATSIYLYLDGVSANNQFLHLDLTKYDSGGVAGSIKFGRDKGTVYLHVYNNDAMECISLDSTLWYLPVGEHTLTLRTDARVAATLTFATPYVGVVLNGL